MGCVRAQEHHGGRAGAHVAARGAVQAAGARRDECPRRRPAPARAALRARLRGPQALRERRLHLQVYSIKYYILALLYIVFVHSQLLQNLLILLMI